MDRYLADNKGISTVMLSLLVTMGMLLLSQGTNIFTNFNSARASHKKNEMIAGQFSGAALEMASKLEAKQYIQESAYSDSHHAHSEYAARWYVQAEPDSKLSLNTTLFDLNLMTLEQKDEFFKSGEARLSQYTNAQVQTKVKLDEPVGGQRLASVEVSFRQNNGKLYRGFTQALVSESYYIDPTGPCVAYKSSQQLQNVYKAVLGRLPTDEQVAAAMQCIREGKLSAMDLETAANPANPACPGVAGLRSTGNWGGNIIPAQGPDLGYALARQSLVTFYRIYLGRFPSAADMPIFNDILNNTIMGGSTGFVNFENLRQGQLRLIAEYSIPSTGHGGGDGYGPLYDYHLEPLQEVYDYLGNLATATPADPWIRPLATGHTTLQNIANAERGSAAYLSRGGGFIDPAQAMERWLFLHYSLIGSFPDAAKTAKYLPLMQRVTWSGLSSFPPGDYSHDGVVDSKDYDFWRANFGNAGPHDADGNNNGTVDAADFVIWRDNFGADWRGENRMTWLAQDLQSSDEFKSANGCSISPPAPLCSAVTNQTATSGWPGYDVTLNPLPVTPAVFERRYTAFGQVTSYSWNGNTGTFADPQETVLSFADTITDPAYPGTITMPQGQVTGPGGTSTCDSVAVYVQPKAQSCSVYALHSEDGYGPAVAPEKLIRVVVDIPAVPMFSSSGPPVTLSDEWTAEPDMQLHKMDYFWNWSNWSNMYQFTRMYNDTLDTVQQTAWVDPFDTSTAGNFSPAVPTNVVVEDVTYNIFDDATQTFGSSQCAAFGRQESPLVVDMYGEGVDFTEAGQGVAFDLKGKGEKGSYFWVENPANAAFLVWDKNGNGAIDDINELFGDNTLGPDGQRASNGFEALRKHDSNRDGFIDSRDPIFKKLRLWQDRNRDGRSTQEEIKSISIIGIKNFDLEYLSIYEMADKHGNHSNQRGVAELYNGSYRRVFDIWLARTQRSAQAGPKMAQR